MTAARSEDWYDTASGGVRGSMAWLQFAGLGGIASIGFVWLGRGLPRIAWLASDSDSYLQFSPVRPHGFSLFLAAYRTLFDDFAYLPAVQLGLYVGAVFLLAFAIGWRTRSFLFAALTLIVVLAGTDTTNFPYLLSDSVYAAAVTGGVACFVLYAGCRRSYLLLLASAGLGLAITFRAIGLVLLPALFMVLLALELGQSGRLGRRLVVTCTLAALPVAVLYCGAAYSQLVHNNRFVLGSWGGMDALGKIPLLSRPVSASPEFSHLNGVVEAMQPARDKLRELSPLVEALAARQYYDYLRWYVIIPEFERSWPEWQQADAYRQGQLAAKLATAYVAEDPFGFLRRAALDLAGLWAMPRWLTEREQGAAQAEIEALGELPFLSRFSKTEEGKLEYHKVIPDPIDPAGIILFRVVVAAFWIVSLGFIALFARRDRLQLLAGTSELVLILVAVHAAYLGTALMEGVYERYIMPTWPLLVAAPALALGLLGPPLRRFIRRPP